MLTFLSSDFLNYRKEEVMQKPKEVVGDERGGLGNRESLTL